MDIKVVGLASDHAAFPLKEYVKQYLEEKGIAYKDYGIGGMMSWGTSVMGANGVMLMIDNIPYRIFGEFMSVDGKLNIYIE